MDQNMRQQHMFRREYFGKSLAVLCGMFLIVLTIAIGAFLLAKGMLTFTQFHHSIGEFLFSSAWKPSDTEMGGGQVGAAIYIWGSILTCTLALVISVPFSLATAVFMTQIAPKLGESEFDSMMSTLEKLFERHQQQGVVPFVYETEVYCGRLAT